MSLTCNPSNSGNLSGSMIGGGHRIGFWSGCQLLINNMVGPALVLIPALFQKYGYFPIFSMLSVACLLSFFCGIMLTHVITNIQSSPNVNIANKRPEMNHIIDYYFPSHPYLKKFIITIYIASIIFTLMSNIIQSAQIIDLAIRDIFSCSYALELYPHFLSIVCGKQHSDVTPFGTDIYVISTGFILLAWICLILYTINYNLDDNIYLQWIANIGLIILSVIWLEIFFNQNTFDSSRVKFVNDNNTQFNSDCVGIILFNFAFIVTIPSWYNEKAPNVSVIKSLLYSLGFVVITFCIIGIFGAMSFDQKDLSGDNQSLFNVIDDFGGRIGKISVYLYPIIQNITSIPVFCIIIRYNLQNSGLSKFTSNFISIIVPWLLSVPLFTGSGFSSLCDFAGIVTGSFVNFILPPYLYILSIQMNVITNKHQMQFMPVDDKSDVDDDDDDSVDENEPNMSRKRRDEIAESDVNESIQLIEMKDTEESDTESIIDIDIAKKNAINCTWDVIVAYICIIIATVLSLVVIIEKIYWWQKDSF